MFVLTWIRTTEKEKRYAYYEKYRMSKEMYEDMKVAAEQEGFELDRHGRAIIKDAGGKFDASTILNGGAGSKKTKNGTFPNVAVFGRRRCDR